MKKRLCDSCIHCECSKSDNPISTIVSCGVTVDCLDYKSVDSAEEVNCEECIYYNMGDGCEYNYCKKEYDDYYYKEKEKNAIKPSHYKAGECEDFTFFDVDREENKEMINHPQHYNMGKYEAIDVIEDWQLNFNLGNTVKYISRAGHKDDIMQDLKKALWYLDREIKRLEKGE